MTTGSFIVITRTMDKECQRGSTEGTAVVTRTELQVEGS
jgi:hypothetical protein